VSVPARRRQVAYGPDRGLSARRACTLFSVARSALRYRGRKAAKDAAVIERMQGLRALARCSTRSAEHMQQAREAVSS
jgi:hypothetical protein